MSIRRNSLPLSPIAPSRIRDSLAWAITLTATLGLVALGACSDSSDDPVAPDAQPEQPTRGPLTAISTMAFGPDNILFVADPMAGKIFALDVTDGSDDADADKHFNLYSIDSLIADHLEAEQGTLAFSDVATHPLSGAVFVGVSAGAGTEAWAEVVRVGADGSVTTIDASGAPSFALSDPISDEVTFWGRVPARTLSITDLDYDDGMLYVAGLTNADFASTLYKIPYPFDGTQAASSVEIYHAAHGQSETRAPIRTQVIVELSGEKYLLAAYTCTPLVAIPLADIQDGAHITGKTIAELGHGNTPKDIMHLTYTDPFTTEPVEAIVLTNQQRGTMMIHVADIEAAIAEPGITEPSGLATAGVAFETIPLDVNAIHTKPQGAARVISLRRNLAAGTTDLLSVPQGVWMRLSEYVAEYDFSAYECPAGAPIEMLSRMLAGMEGIDLESIETGRICG